MTLSAFIRFNREAIPNRGRLRQVFGLSDENLIADKVDALMKQVHLEGSLAALGIGAEGRALILRDGFRPDRVANNPRPVAPEDLKQILEGIA